MASKREILNNPCFQHITDVHDITAQYFKNLDMHFFGHGIIYPNGNFSILNSRSDWGEDIFGEKQLPPIGFNIYDKITDRVFFPTMDHGAPLGWPDSATRESKERFNILNPMMITRKYSDHYEIYIFDLHHEHAYEIYLNQFEVFENFMHYHKDKSKKLIQAVLKTPFQVDPAYLNQNPTPSSSKNIATKTSLIIPSLKKYYLRHKNKDVILSSKEYQCLWLLAHGKQTKRIAAKLNLSLRTVETYFDRIKKKLGLSTREQLARAYWENRILSG